MIRRYLFLVLFTLSASSPALPPAQARLASDIIAIERDTGGRLGAVLIDEAGTVILSHRVNERFAMCSAFKLALAGAALKAVDSGELRADNILHFKKADLLYHSPVMTERVKGEDGRTTLIDVARAATEASDNLAANLLLRQLGGPVGLTRRLRAMGDRVTRLDRYELELNQNLPGDPRDSSTPAAMVASVRSLLFGPLLSPLSRDQLRVWTRDSKTGLQRVRAGLPSSWPTGDKTGTCSNERGPHPQYNDIGWFIAPSGKHFAFAVMLDHPKVSRDSSEAAMAKIGTLAAKAAR